jgi:hypothetical protein
MAEILDCVLLLALPASGKSEIRRYMARLPEDECRRDFHMGPTVQLDDFPYVHLMRRIDEELEKIGRERIFFQSGEKPFREPKDWGTLVEMVNEDYEDLLAGKMFEPKSAAMNLFHRLDEASKKAMTKPRLGALDPDTLAGLARKLESEAQEMLKEKHANHPEDLQGKTIVIEFARGGPDGSSMPLKEPYGYRYSLCQLSASILKKSSILYVWTTPEESRRKNVARADPGDPGSILHHGVPLDVMMNDYGCDDMDWLEQNSQKPGTVTIEAWGKTYHIPVARFDNRVDKTSFIRNDPAQWKPEEVKAIHEGLKEALGKLAGLAKS